MRQGLLRWFLVGALTSTACVKRSEYDALKAQSAKQVDGLEGQVAAQKERALSLEQALAEEQAKVKLQADEIASLAAQLGAAQTQLQQQRNELAETIKNSSGLKSSIQEMQEALDALREQKRLTEMRIAEFRKLLQSFEALIDAGKLKVKVVRGRMVVELPADVLFASGSIELSEAGKASVAQVGAVFVTMADREFEVKGHTDDQPIKTTRFPSNWELAAGRAIAVAQMLIGSGVAPTRVSAASFGEFRPVASNKTPETRAQNRRIEIVLVPDLSKVPGFEELEKAVKN